MPPFTKEQIRQRLCQVQSDELTGSTTNKFLSVYKQTGLTWKTVMTYFAESGYRWKDAAAFFNINLSTLQSHCYKQGIVFPFKGQGHPESLASRHKDREKNPDKYRREYTPRQYTAFGVTASLSQLVQRFGHPSVTYKNAVERINRMGWPVEEALLLPVGQKTGNGSWRKAA